VDLILFVIGLSFSFFFILLSYWKEDKNLHIIGSVTLMILFIILTGTGVQSTGLVTAAQSSLETTIGNATVYNKTMSVISAYNAQIYNNGVFYEHIGIGVMLVIFTALEYLYFALVYKFSSEGT
jgi:hypothetical protein